MCRESADARIVDKCVSLFQSFLEAVSFVLFFEVLSSSSRYYILSTSTHKLPVYLYEKLPCVWRHLFFPLVFPA